MKREHDFRIIIELDEAGYIVDVISLCLDDFKVTGKPVPRQAEIIGVRRVEVMV